MSINHQPSQPRLSVIISGISLALGLLFDYFFYNHLPGLSATLYVALIIGGLFALAAYRKRRVTRTSLWLLAPLLFFSLMVMIRSSGPLTLLNLAMILFLLLLIVQVSFGRTLKSLLVRDYVKTPFVPIAFFQPLLRTLTDSLKIIAVPKEQKVLAQIIKGTVITIPVLGIFLLLFASADLIFQKYLLDLAQFHVAPEAIARTIWILVVALGFIGAYTYTLLNAQDQAPSEEKSKTPFLGKIESSILLGSVNALFLAFILIQIAYLFGGQNNISAQGFTYAEYARKGFFELITVALVSFGLLWVAERYTAKRDADHFAPFKILSAALIVQVVIIMASAFKRLWLYEEAYGFTTLRLYSHVFTLLLAVIFMFLLYKILKNGRENLLALRTFIAVMASLVALNLLNPDAFIARQNINRFGPTDKLDVVYLARLSDDAIPETVKALDIPNKDLAKRLAGELYWRRAEHQAGSEGWQSWNLARQTATQTLDAQASKLEPYKNYETLRSSR